MGVFEMVVALVLIGTVGKVAQAWAGRPSGWDASAAEARIRALEAELQANETRLAQTEERVEHLDEKLAFVEELLAKPRRAAELPPASE